VPYCLRLFNGNLLVATTEHETTEELGRQAAEYPVGEWMEEAPDGSRRASLRREVVYLDETGNERRATLEEDNMVFEAMVSRSAEIADGQAPPCPRCGRKAADQEHPYPVWVTPDGPICFGCWTSEERARTATED
jgi:hypothetical protein